MKYGWRIYYGGIVAISLLLYFLPWTELNGRFTAGFIGFVVGMEVRRSIDEWQAQKFKGPERNMQE